MEKTVLYFIRHGQSEGNLKDLFLGFTDLDLTELGHKQASLAASFFQDVPVDKIYSSDLKRAYHTALHTARAKGLDVHTCQGMREIFAGQCAVGGVDSELETESVDLFAEGLDARRKCAEVALESAVCITGRGHPAVVNVDVLITAICKT